VKNLHKRDLAEGYHGVFMPGLMNQKYKNSAKEFAWHFFFLRKR